MDRPQDPALGRLWDTNAPTGDVETHAQALEEDNARRSHSGSQSGGSHGGGSHGGKPAGSLSSDENLAIVGLSREAATVRNVTVLPFVEGSGKTVQLKPRNEMRYQRVKQLGTGAMGEVTLVRDNDIGRTVAVKQLTARTQNPDGIARFIEEIRTVGRLEHPNIVPIHDVGVDELGQIFFVMKHIDGETLETIINKLDAQDPDYLERYTIDCRIEIFIGLLHALEFAHNQGIIHRDIKPANVMVGRYGEVVLMDWGLAKLRRPEGSAPDSPFTTQEGMVLGTPAYMSPEQAMGQNSKVDERSDIYGATVLFHELLAVRHYLAHCRDQRQLMGSIFSERFPYMRLVFIRNPKHPVPPAELLHFIAKGLAKDSNERYQNVQQMLAALQRIRAGRCPVNCPATLAKRMTDTVGKAVNRYPKLSPFLFYPALLIILTSLLMSARQLLMMKL